MKVPTNLLRDAVRYYTEFLEPNYGSDESKQLVFALTEHFFGFDRLKLAFQPGHRLSESEMLTLHFAVKELKSGKPLQYITGVAHFSGHRFFVNTSVLIPRPETEELVNLAADFCRRMEHSSNVLDVGTGSGCIAISIKKLCPQARVQGCDISSEALSVAHQNALSLDADVDFFVCDIQSYDSGYQPCTFDLLVSNPPYVLYADKIDMKSNVLEWEPHLALFAPDEDPVFYYRKLASMALNCLVPTGRLMVEIHEKMGEAVSNLFTESGFSVVSVYHDINGKERFIVATKQ